LVKEAAVLSVSHRFKPVLALLLVAILSLSVSSTEPAATPKQIAEWIEQLGDNDFQVRENASKKLWQAGTAAESALEKAAKSDDPEVARRCRDLLDKFHWGIYPDTPADIVALIRAYQSSEGKPRLEILQKLLESGEPGLRAVQKFVGAETDANHRKALGDLIVNRLPAAFFLAASEGKYEYCERLLELGQEGKFISPNQYAAYWLLRSKILERIALVTSRFNKHPQDKWIVQTLVYLHRANGDLVQARKAAEKCDRSELLESILLEMADWKALAARRDFAGAEYPAEKWAFRAAFARLAGNQKGFVKAVGELRVFASADEQRTLQAFVAAKALLLNDRPADGLELLRTIPERRQELFDLLCARLEFASALDLAGKEVSQDKLIRIPELHLARARLLCLLGEKEGEVRFDRYAERIKDGVDPDWVQSLLAEELRAGLKEKAFSHAATALTVSPPKNKGQSNRESREHRYFARLFPQQTQMAAVWWTVLRGQLREEPSETVLKRLRDLLEGKVATQDIKAWIARDQSLTVTFPPDNFPPSQMQAWMQGLAEGAILARLDDLASDLLKKADSRDSLIRLGDLLAAKKQWAKAAESYLRAWKKEQQLEKDHAARMRSDSLDKREAQGPLPLYLAGDALVRAGQQTEGTKLIEQAHWLPFADTATRFNFLRALDQRGHTEAARREIELLIRLGEPTALHVKEALRLHARDDLKRKDYLKVAECFEQSMLNCLRADTGYILKDRYCYVPAQIHQLRASGLLAAGRVEEALKHIDLSLTDSPGNIDLPIALLPQLERRGRKKEATELFNRSNGTIEKVCRDYPRCAWAHNSAAWMAACCRRNLDSALEHAQKAVELSPMHAGYHDTLAEIRFQLGNKVEAITLQKRAIELDPKRPYYRKQLKRIEAGDPTVERPLENDD
jgi:tetratricopeptide (TPR) repeat protein